jgi:hypothetical protein
VVDAVTHSPYFDDTALFVVEDDAQDGADHVDAHRSPALVISKYSPGSPARPFVDSAFYTTVSVIHTMEGLLGLPSMNVNDANSPMMAPLFSGHGNQQPFDADYSNEKNGLLFQKNTDQSPGAAESSKMNFKDADAIDPQKLNRILWEDRKGPGSKPPQMGAQK